MNNFYGRNRDIASFARHFPFGGEARRNFDMLTAVNVTVENIMTSALVTRFLARHYINIFDNV